MKTPEEYFKEMCPNNEMENYFSRIFLTNIYKLMGSYARYCHDEYTISRKEAEKMAEKYIQYNDEENDVIIDGSTNAPEFLVNFAEKYMYEESKNKFKI